MYFYYSHDVLDQMLTLQPDLEVEFEGISGRIKRSKITRQGGKLWIMDGGLEVKPESVKLKIC
jgi:hypothetical protein